MSDTIAAISTGLVPSGVAVIRVSGKDSLAVAEKVFKPVGKTSVKDFEPNKMYVGEIVADGFTDFGMCVYFKAPKSFTGEDSVELHCHGGLAITKGVLRSVLSSGARIAKNGEFTRRAFMNGKLSLSSAEGLIDMINSESESGVKAGYYLYREKLTAEIERMQNLLTDALSEIDADMDFPEEDLDVKSRETAEKTLKEVTEKISALLKTYRGGRIIKDGVKVAIAGKPNTGKSSLLNALLDYDKAIVSSVAGTTRDVVEGKISYKGVNFFFFDTAGIRESGDEIEQIGVGLSKKITDSADLIVFVVDGSDISSDDEEIYNDIKDKNLLVVLNKSDVGEFFYEKADIKVSAKEKINLDGLKECIYNKTVGNGIDLNGDFICEERHFEALKRAYESLSFALSSVKTLPLDLLSVDVKDGWDALGEISGKTASEEIIDNIFSRFCVGK